MSSATGTAPSFIPDGPVTVLDVPIDGREELAVPVAAWLASMWGIPIRLLNVDLPDGPHFDLDRVSADATARWPNLAIEGERLRGDDVASAIVEGVEDTSLLVVSTDNANAWSFKNSVAERLVHRAGVPLILLGPLAAQPDHTGDIVVAYDGRPPADAALDAAVALAPALGRNLWLIQVAPEPLTPSDNPVPDVERHLHGKLSEIDSAINPRFEVVRSNDPVSSIEAFAARVGASFIVAGSRSRDDETRTTMSSITMGLVANSGRPVLVVGH